jgi:hypothetical protein
MKQDILKIMEHKGGRQVSRELTDNVMRLQINDGAMFDPDFNLPILQDLKKNITTEIFCTEKLSTLNWIKHLCVLNTLSQTQLVLRL